MSNDHGPWRWQLIAVLEQVREHLRELNEKMEKMLSLSDTQRKLSEAGKKSAAMRKAKFGSARPGTMLIDIPCEPVREGVREGVRKKKGARTDGAQVWDSYKQSYITRHGHEPLRNARVNMICASLVSLVGADLAVRLVEYYVSRNDAFYVNASHPIGLCLRDAQKLVTELRTGTQVTMTDARRLEAQSQNERVCEEYLRKADLREQVEDEGWENT